MEFVDFNLAYVAQVLLSRYLIPIVRFHGFVWL
jgi:hypothetical protein